MKPCFKCGIVKPLIDFYQHKQMSDRHLGKCKDCAKLDVRMNYETRHDQYIAYEHKRRPRTKVQRKYVSEAELLLHKRANTAVQIALRSQKLQKHPCETCGSTNRIHAHHDDYSKPLNVRWLCPKHHAEHHQHNTKIWQPIEKPRT